MKPTRTFPYRVSFFDCAAFSVDAPNREAACRLARLRYQQAYPMQWAAIIRIERSVALPAAKRRIRKSRQPDDEAPL